MNYARSHIGSNGEDDAPDIDGQYSDFILETIAKAPHDGEFYLTDRMQVFKMIVQYVFLHKASIQTESATSASFVR